MTDPPLVSRTFRFRGRSIRPTQDHATETGRGVHDRGGNARFTHDVFGDVEEGPGRGDQLEGGGLQVLEAVVRSIVGHRSPFEKRTVSVPSSRLAPATVRRRNESGSTIARR